MDSRHLKGATLLFSLMIFTLIGCKINYGFNPTVGGDDAYRGKPISIDVFQAYAPLAPSTLSQSFTEDLRDVFIQQSKMTLTDRSDSLHFEGSITGYDVRPVAITSTEVAASNRLTISVNVKCFNSIKPDESFEQTFSRFADFETAQSLSAVEDDLIEEITEQLIQDIFNRSLGDW